MDDPGNYDGNQTYLDTEVVDNINWIHKLINTKFVTQFGWLDELEEPIKMV